MAYTINDIKTAWQIDCRIDKTELGDESLKVSQLHAKYMNLLDDVKTEWVEESATFKSLQRQLKIYYTGQADRNLLALLERDQFLGRVPSSKLDDIISIDPLYIKSDKEVKLIHNKIEYLEDVLKELKNRNWHIRNYIEYYKYAQGQI